MAGAALTALPGQCECGTGSLRRRGPQPVDWERFLGEQDLVWQRMPRAWYEGPFLGNGFLGHRGLPGAGRERHQVHRRPRRGAGPPAASSATNGEWRGFRSDGSLLTPVGKITGVDLRLDLWNAELRGTITTDKGTLKIRSFVHAEKSLLHLEVRPTSGERDVHAGVHGARRAEPAHDPRATARTFPLNPKPVTRTENGLTLVTQEMVAGGQTATAYRTRRHHGSTDFLLSVDHSFPAPHRRGRPSGRHHDRRSVTGAAAPPAPEVVASLLPQEFRVRAGRVDAELLLDPAVQARLGRAQGSADHAHHRAVAGADAVAVGVVQPQRPAGVLAGARRRTTSNWTRSRARSRQNQQILVDALRPEFRADSMGLRRSTDPTFQDAGFVGSPLHPSPDPEIGNLPWLLHNAWLSYRHTHGRADPARHRLPGAAPIHQLLPALPAQGRRRQAAPAAHLLARVRRGARLQLRPRVAALVVPHAHRVGAKILKIDDPLARALAGGAGPARRVPGRRGRVHDRRRGAVREVAPALLAHARRLPAARGHLGAAGTPRPHRTLAEPLAELRGIVARLHLHRRRVDRGPDDARRRGAALPARVRGPVRAAEHHVLRGRAGDRDAAERREVVAGHAGARAGAG